MQPLDICQPHTAAANSGKGGYGGCSPFFINSSVLSLYTSWQNRKIALANAKDDIKFAELLQQEKQDHEDWKDAEERALKIWLRDQKRDFARRTAYEKFSRDLAEADLKMFFADWPLQISVEALLKEMSEKPDRMTHMRFIIGRFYAGAPKDALSSSYPAIVDNVTALLQEMGVTDTRVYRFKDNPTAVGGPALANIYAMMSTFPVVAIMPSIDNKLKQIRFTVGCWTPDTPFPFQSRVMSMDFSQQRVNNDRAYLEAAIAKVTYVCTTIAGVLYDTYNLSEGRGSCVFPKFAAAKSLSSRYPELTDYAAGEYRALANHNAEVATADGTKLNVWSEAGNMLESEISEIVKKSIALIKG